MDEVNAIDEVIDRLRNDRLCRVKVSRDVWNDFDSMKYLDMAYVEYTQVVHGHGDFEQSAIVWLPRAFVVVDIGTGEKSYVIMFAPATPDQMMEIIRSAVAENGMEALDGKSVHG